jgi:ubiquinone/menaquinone biosynthesis C-methylase UbiE
MKTDYSRIASRYDNNPLRQKPVDPEIKRLLAVKDSIKVLDIACGTGNYLQSQVTEYGSSRVKWTGIDQSEAMLEIAQKKVPDAKFLCFAAEEINLPAGSFDYIRNEYSFHHFTDKKAFLENVFRLLKDDSLFIMVNICRDYIRNSWVYHYFPSAREADENKFISTDAIWLMMADAGLKPEIRITTTVAPLDYPARIAEAENRDMSQLQHISEDEYRQGLARMREDRSAGHVYIADYAELVCRTLK